MTEQGRRRTGPVGPVRSGPKVGKATRPDPDFAQFLVEACEPANLPLAFMCNAGKDRTAVGALLLLTALRRC